jgi:hypothetical protein
MTRRLTFTKLAATGLCAGLMFAACGSSGGSSASSSEGKKYVAAMLAAKGSNSITKDLNPTQAKCLAEGLIDAVGVDTLKKAGVTPQEFAGNGADTKLKGKVSKSQASDVADLILKNKCFDFIDVVAKQSSGSAFGKLSKDKQRCFYTKMFSLPAVRDALIADLTGGKSDLGSALGNQSEIFTILGQCKIDPKDVSG